MILVCFTRQALATVNRAACVTLTMYCLTAINQLVKRKVLTMDEYELKPCPFCGGKARLIYVYQMSVVKCPKCKTLGKAFPDYYEQGDGKGDAIKFWNTRAKNG